MARTTSMRPSCLPAGPALATGRPGRRRAASVVSRRGVVQGSVGRIDRVPGATMIDLSAVDLDELAMALADQDGFEHHWLIDPDSIKRSLFAIGSFKTGKTSWNQNLQMILLRNDALNNLAICKHTIIKS